MVDVSDVLAAKRVICAIFDTGVEMDGKRYRGWVGVLRFVRGVLKSC